MICNQDHKNGECVYSDCAPRFELIKHDNGAGVHYDAITDSILVCGKTPEEAITGLISTLSLKK